MSSVRDFGAKGDGKADDTSALHHAVQHCDGELVFPRGDYVLSRPLYIPLEMHGRLSIRGGGVARLIMRGAGPALHLVGSHGKTALPADFDDRVWQKERMPTVEGLEIVGEHAQADGVRAEGVMQPTFVGVLIRRCRHGIHLATRDRNVLVNGCHVYDNTGVGVFLDRVNLHQVNITGSHISYCKQAGIKVAGSEVRNIQIVGNDIEYNFDATATAPSADVVFDCREGTVREGTLVGNTIQAKRSPGGANVRLVGVGKDPSAVGLLAITGNLIGSQETALDLRSCRGVVVSGNAIYSGYRHALVAEDCEHLVVSGNSIDHNPEYRGTSTDQVVLRRCRSVNVGGLILQHTREAGDKVEASVELHDCRDVSFTGCQVVGARSRGFLLRGCSLVRVADCTIRPRDGDATYRAALTADEKCAQLMLVNNFVAAGSDGDIQRGPKSGVASGNVTI